MAIHSSILAKIIPWTVSLAGYSPWGCKESDMTEHLHFLSLRTGKGPRKMQPGEGTERKLSAKLLHVQ